MIKTVIFDLGGVYFSDGTKNAIEAMHFNYKIPIDKLEEVFKGDLGSIYREGKISETEFWNEANRLWGINEKHEQLRNIWFGGYLPIPGTVDLVMRIRQKGYQVLFLSDNVQERVDYLNDRYKFLANFDDGVFSHIVRARKPDMAIYRALLEKTTSKPEECLYIDDKDSLLKSAAELGMKTILFTGPEFLKEELKKYGIDTSNLVERYSGPKFKTFFTAEHTPTDDRVKKIINWGKKFSLLGVTPAFEFSAAGNLSFRTQLGFIITGAGKNLGTLKEEEFVEVLDCNLEKKEIIAKGKLEPSSESMMHYAVYKTRHEINVIFHVHDDFAVTNCSALGLRCTAEEKPAGTTELIEEILKVLENLDYIVIKNHGIISLGGTIEEAGERIVDINNKVKGLA